MLVIGLWESYASEQQYRSLSYRNFISDSQKSFGPADEGARLRKLVAGSERR